MRTFLILLMLTLPAGIAGAQSSGDVTGEVINVNSRYRIAFTDLSRDKLAVGDTVRIDVGGLNYVYLKVIETSKILSKLGPSDDKIYQTNQSDFDKIAVGNPVVKLTGAMRRAAAGGEEAAYVPDESGLARELIEATAELEALKSRNTELKREVVRLSAEQELFEEMRKDYEVRIARLNSVIDELRKKLKNINGMLSNLIGK